jgi:Holliday junction resolvase-like predicted endonuclease
MKNLFNKAKNLLKRSKNICRKNEKLHNSSFESGKFAEFKAIFYLFFLKLYFPIKIRYKTKSGEIDLICIHIFSKKLAFIEVKNRNSTEVLFDSISKFQINRILNTAQIFLKNNQNYQDYRIEFLGVFFENLKFKKIFTIEI